MRRSPEPVATATPAATVPAAAPVAVAGPDIPVLYDGGAETWIQPAADAFNQQHGGAKITLTKMPSRAGRDHILYDKKDVHPVVWNPGDIYWIDKLKMDAANPSLPSKSGATAGDPTPLLHTYIVLLMSDARAKVFTTAMAQPEYQGKTWGLLRTLATKGWGAVGGPAEWGKLKLGQTDPTASNSAMTALTLMFGEWEAAHPGKDFNDKDFLAMMGDIEGAVGTPAPATSALLEAIGSGNADVAIVYESDALRALQGGAKGLHVVYPSPTDAVTVPAVVVQGAWVTPDRAKLGQAFVDYLASDDVQAKALQSGYRPASEAQAGKTTEAMGAFQAVGIEPNPKAAPDADTKTKEGLIFNWNQWHKAHGGG
jgi:ABC-type Fe3+ transport system substrate-binding protein